MESTTKGAMAIAEPAEEKRPMGRAAVQHDEAGRILEPADAGSAGAVSPSEASPYLSLHVFRDGRLQIDTSGMSITLDPKLAASQSGKMTTFGIHPVSKCP